MNKQVMTKTERLARAIKQIAIAADKIKDEKDRQYWAFTRQAKGKPVDPQLTRAFYKCLDKIQELRLVNSYCFLHKASLSKGEFKMSCETCEKICDARTSFESRKHPSMDKAIVLLKKMHESKSYDEWSHYKHQFRLLPPNVQTHARKLSGITKNK